MLEFSIFDAKTTDCGRRVAIEVDWTKLRDLERRAAELVVRDKARRQDRSPLPAEVGEALVAYLSAGWHPVNAVHLCPHLSCTCVPTCRAPVSPPVVRLCPHLSCACRAPGGPTRADQGRGIRFGVKSPPNSPKRPRVGLRPRHSCRDRPNSATRPRPREARPVRGTARVIPAYRG